VIVEERIYTAIPGKALEYVRMYEAKGLAIQRPILGHLVDYFTSEIGTLNQLSQENKILVPAAFSPWAKGPAY
jgi:hypothetical protein